MKSRDTETVEPGRPDDEIRFLAPGTVIGGRFEIDRPLGTGGYAVVYAAYDHELAHDVTVKVLRNDRVTLSSVKRMRREVSIARDIVSPRLVRLHDIDTDRGLSYITMELVQGTSLHKQLRSGPLAVDEAIRIADSILEALEALHSHNVIHRDLKPANVLVTPEGEIKLADFGLARHWENEGISATRTAALVGTLEYLSPEQALGKDLDPRADLYSFGVLLYEMLAGRLPFESASSLGAVVAHVTKHAPDVRRVRPDVPAWLAVLVQNLLEKDRSHRPPDATAVRTALRAAKMDWGYRWRRGRARALTTVAAILVVATVSAFAWNHHQTRFERITSDPNGTLHALDRDGRVLWTRDDMPAGKRAAAVTVLEGERQVFGIPAAAQGTRDSDAASTRPLVVLDAQTGVQLDLLSMPLPPPVFPTPPGFNLGGIRAVDFERDGLEEIVTSYVHVDDWPSYSLLIDPRKKESRVIFLASGHHVVLGAVDADGDGIDEILIGGTNPNLGSHYGVAAIRVAGESFDSGTTHIPASTPDTFWGETTSALVWYALQPSTTSSTARLDRVQHDMRTFDLVFENGARERLTFDGFAVSAVSQLPASERRRRRNFAYEFLRDADLAEALGNLNTARSKAMRAKQAARDARDPVLESWIGDRFSSLPPAEP